MERSKVAAGMELLDGSGSALDINRNGSLPSGEITIMGKAKPVVVVERRIKGKKPKGKEVVPIKAKDKKRGSSLNIHQ